MIVASGVNRIAGGTMEARRIAVLRTSEPGKRSLMIAYAVMYEMNTLTIVDATETNIVLANHWRYAVVVRSSTMCENVKCSIQKGFEVFRSSGFDLNVVSAIQ